MMEVTSNVVTDLLPTYLAGEASADTRVLVEEFLKADPEFARRVETEWSQNLMLLKTSQVTIGPDGERIALERTKKYLKARPLCLMMGILFLSLPLMLTFSSGEGLQFVLWRPDFPRWAALAITAVCLMNAAGAWVGYIWLRRRLRGTGL